MGSLRWRVVLAAAALPLVQAACDHAAGVGSRSVPLEQVQEEAEAPDQGVPVAVQVTPVVIPIPDDDLDDDGAPRWLDPDDADPLVLPSPDAGPEVDDDGDGVSAEHDCEDDDPTVSPFAVEVRCNGRDENCDGIDDCDTDGDGSLDRDDPDPLDPLIAEEIPLATGREEAE